MMTTSTKHTYADSQTPTKIYVEAIRHSDNKGIAKIYQEFFGLAKQSIIRLGGRKEDAEDIFQEALIVIYQKINNNTLPFIKSFGAYLLGVCKYLWKSNSRQKFRREITGLTRDNELDGEDLVEQIEQRERDAFFNKKLRKLPLDQQKVLSLYFEGNSMKQIATKMGYGSAAYAKKKKAVCKKRLLNMIQRDPLYKELACA